MRTDDHKLCNRFRNEALHFVFEQCRRRSNVSRFGLSRSIFRYCPFSRARSSHDLQTIPFMRYQPSTPQNVARAIVVM